MERGLRHAVASVQRHQVPFNGVRPIRLYSSTPILSGREVRQGFERIWTPTRYQRPLPKVMPASTAHRYYLLPSELTKTGQSSVAKAPNGKLKRSFIFDLPDLKPGQEGFESLRDLRLRVYHERIRAQRTIEREIEDARWFADPWYRMKQTPPRGCIVTRNRLPSAFLICFKPVHRANEQDNPGRETSAQLATSDEDDHLNIEDDAFSDEETAEGDHQATELDVSSSKSQINHPDSILRNQTGRSVDGKTMPRNSGNSPSRSERNPSRIVDPLATLVPHYVLHPKYSPVRGGRSTYVTARREVVEQLLAREGSHVLELPRLARRLHLPPLLPDMVQSQLEQRVIQELEMLLSRVRATAADPQGKLRSAFQPSTKKLSAELENENGAEADAVNIPLTTRKASVDSSWMQSINGDKRLLYRLSDIDAGRVRAGDGYVDPDVIALIDFQGLDPATRMLSNERSPSSVIVTSSDLPAVVNAGPKGRDLTERRSEQRVTMISGPKGDMPVFHIRNLLTSPLHAEAHTLLGAILGVETMIKDRLDARKPALSLAADTSARPTDKPADEVDESEEPPIGVANAPSAQVNEVLDSGSEADIRLLKSDLVALTSWAAPKDLTGRRGDLAVPLVIALYRLRLWHGEGWKQKLVNNRGFEV